MFCAKFKGSNLSMIIGMQIYKFTKLVTWSRPRLLLGHTMYLFISAHRIILSTTLSLFSVIQQPIGLKSQCSTVVRNTVVRATVKVNGKHPNLSTRRAQTLWPIDFKFDVSDYVGCMTPHAKNCENRPRRAAPAYGWNIMFKCFLFF